MKRSTRMFLMNANRGSDRGGQESDRSDYGRARNYYGWNEYGGSGGRGEYRGYDYPRGEYGEGRMEYGRAYFGEYYPESRFRDRRGREHYDNGRFAPRSEYGYPYEYDDEGRMEYRMDGRGGNRPGSGQGGNARSYEEGSPRMIGFGREWGEEMRSDATMPHYQEMNRMQGNRAMQGYSNSEYEPQFDRRMAEEWASNMENEDGTQGPHWTLDQAKQLMAQKEIGGSPLKFWVSLNAMYSDYSKVAKKLGVNTVDFYVCMAEAFLNDKDAQPDKLARYYEYVVKH